MRVPLSKPDITEREMAAVAEVLRSGVLSLGRFTERFEASVAGFVGTRGAVAVSSGTGGLHLALLAAGARPKDHIITTPFSFIASSNAALYVGARPVFVDVEPDTGNMSPRALRELLEERYVRDASGHVVCRKTHARVAAVLPVHVFGHPCRMDEIWAVAEEYGLPVVEDACEALGSLFYSQKKKKWLSVGQGSLAGVFAFYPNKQITTGEGGMVVSDDPGVIRFLRSTRNHGREDTGPWLSHARLGFNYRMDEMSAALGTVQMMRVHEMRAKRRAVAEMYAQVLSEIQELELPPEGDGVEVNPFVYVVKVPRDQRDGLMQNLLSHGIGTRPYFTPIHLQSFYAENFGYRGGEFPVAEDLGQRCLALPFYNDLSEAEVNYVAKVIKNWFSKKNKIGRRKVEKYPEVNETNAPEEDYLLSVRREPLGSRGRGLGPVD